MANTVSSLSYANTFGDWVVTTNALVKENNDLAANNYTKPTGTLYLNDSTLGLQVANNAIIAGQLQVQGIGSSGYIQNNLRVDGTEYLTNTVLSLVASGQANVGGPLLALGSGTGLTVANNALVSGNLTVSTNESIGGTLTVTGNTALSENLTVAGKSTLTGNVAAGAYVTVVNDVNAANFNASSLTTTAGLVVDNSATIGDNVTIGGQLAVGGNFVIDGTTVYNTNTFTINAGSNTGITSTFNVNRGDSGANGSIRWNESSKYWDILDVNTGGTYSKILTANLITDSVTSTSSGTIASSAAANTLNNGILTLNSNLASNVASLQSQISSNVTSLQSQISSNSSTSSAGISAAYARANTSANSFVGTSGTITPTSGSITFTSTNGITAVGSGNTITFNTAQDIRTSANPTFNGLSLTNALPITQGGTGATSAGAALTALLPTGTTSGYVLTTSGPGSFYWAAVGSITAVPGTTIQSSRLSYTANGTGLGYTTPTYVPGASQLRVYIDGVRQFPSEYTETSATVVTFNSSPPAGTKILVEVDGYINNPYYANNITFTAPQGSIPSSANTIQLAIQDIESRKAALAGASFTGVVTGLTVDTNASNTAFATTTFVKNALNQSANTFSHSISGNAGTVTNGVYTNGSYSNPSWITALAGSKISGDITGNAANITAYTVNQSVGTTNNVQHASLGVGTAASGTSGEIRATNNITAYYSSDRKYKENIQNIPGALSKVECIGGKLFDWTDEYIEQHGGADGYFVQKSDFGVIAQDVQQVFPQAVRTREDGTLAVDYAKLSALAFAAIVELKAEIDALKGK